MESQEEYDKLIEKYKILYRNFRDICDRYNELHDKHNHLSQRFNKYQYRTIIVINLLLLSLVVSNFIKFIET
jgi:hypothetical protein